MVTWIRLRKKSKAARAVPGSASDMAGDGAAVLPVHHEHGGWVAYPRCRSPVGKQGISATGCELENNFRDTNTLLFFMGTGVVDDPLHLGLRAGAGDILGCQPSCHQSFGQFMADDKGAERHDVGIVALD